MYVFFQTSDATYKASPLEERAYISAPQTSADIAMEVESEEIIEDVITLAAESPVDEIDLEDDSENVAIEVKEKIEIIEGDAPVEVPFYSQFNDISDPEWQKVGCGIASLAMLIDYYEPAVSVDKLLGEGVSAGAYLDSAGWTYAGLISVAKKYGVTGQSFDLAGQGMENAFAKFESAVEEGPVMASVYYTFTPGHPIPHLVVVNDVKDGMVYYNDPAEPAGGGTISVAAFKAAWKKRYIEFWPV